MNSQLRLYIAHNSSDLSWYWPHKAAAATGIIVQLFLGHTASSTPDLVASKGGIAVTIFPRACPWYRIASAVSLRSNTRSTQESLFLKPSVREWHSDHWCWLFATKVAYLWLTKGAATIVDINRPTMPMIDFGAPATPAPTNMPFRTNQTHRISRNERFLTKPKIRSVRC
jgi:hypothetical protein